MQGVKVGCVMVSKVMTVEASADEKQVYQCLSLGEGGTKEVPSACQSSSDKTGLLCVKHNNAKGHVLKISIHG